MYSENGSTSVQTYNNLNAGAGYLTGVFMAQVTNISLASNGDAILTLGAVDYTSGQFASLSNAFKDAFGSYDAQNDTWTKDNASEVLKMYWSTDLASVPTQTYSSTNVNNIVSGDLWSSFQLGSADDFSVNILSQYVGGTVPQGNYFGTMDFSLSPTAGLAVQTLLGNTGGWQAAQASATGLGLTRTRQTGDYQVAIGDRAEIYATPEPATMIAMGSGLLGLFGLRRRARKN
ncbi:PEP-CTERM sorting domain-containing protein [Fundidesulfovibrio magnetotacticus]|nr:PEP-CTERM sorting domain-containing protein [Fundidesulfovibrio magnetotacticus]